MLSRKIVMVRPTVQSFTRFNKSISLRLRQYENGKIMLHQRLKQLSSQFISFFDGLVWICDATEQDKTPLSLNSCLDKTLGGLIFASTKVPHGSSCL